MNQLNILSGYTKKKTITLNQLKKGIYFINILNKHRPRMIQLKMCMFKYDDIPNEDDDPSRRLTNHHTIKPEKGTNNICLIREKK